MIVRMLCQTGHWVEVHASGIVSYLFEELKADLEPDADTEAELVR